MTTNAPSLGATTPSAFDAPACPSCAGRMRLTWHRPIDRLVTKVAPIRRYRCQSASCRWEGNVRFDPHAVTPRRLAPVDEAATDGGTPAGTQAPAARVSVVAQAMLTVVGALLVAAFRAVR